MFDLKAKLLEKGLVTKEQVDKISAKKPHDQKNASANFADRERKKVLQQLLAQSKSEQYLTIRKWVDNNRQDKKPFGLDDGEKFFFTTEENQITWLTLAKSVVEDIKQGRSGVIAYMSNHGLTHAVVPRDIAEDVGEAFPAWLRILNNS